MSKAVIIIPARYGSSRLPGKPLLNIVGKPVTQHVYEHALQMANVAEVWVTMDDQYVEKAVQAFGGKTIMVRNDHEFGTDRLIEVMHEVGADICINLQDDEPMIRPWNVDTPLQGIHDDPALPVATLCHAISTEEATEPSTVEMVVDTHQDALYFSRSPTPYPRNAEKARYPKRVGACVYRHDMLQSYSQLPESMSEQAESLEQLWLMNAGIGIRVFKIAAAGLNVDTPACLEEVRTLMAQGLAENAWLAFTRLASDVFHIWRSFWRNHARNFLCCTLFRKKLMLPPCKDIVSARRSQSPLPRQRENPSFVWKMGLCVRWILASMANHRFL